MVRVLVVATVYKWYTAVFAAMCNAQDDHYIVAVMVMLYLIGF